MSKKLSSPFQKKFDAEKCNVIIKKISIPKHQYEERMNKAIDILLHGYFRSVFKEVKILRKKNILNNPNEDVFSKRKALI